MKHQTIEILEKERKEINEEIDRKIAKLKDAISQETYLIEGFEVTKPKICKTFDEAKNCPKGFRLPTRWELFKIFEKMKNKKKLSDGDYMFFWSSLIEDNYSKGLFLYWDLDLDSDDGSLANSYDSGRVVWVRDIKESK